MLQRKEIIVLRTITIFLAIFAVFGAAPAVGSPCRGNGWQPTYVHDLVNQDDRPYYVMPDGRFVLLTGDWANQSGPGMCCLYGVRDSRGFSTCFEYTRIQCGCDLQSLGNDTCRRFLAERGAVQRQTLIGRWQGCDGRVVEFSEVGGTLRGTYVVLGGLGSYGFSLGEVGYEAREVSPGVFEGRVLWKQSGGQNLQWRPNRITIDGDDYRDTGSDNCSRSMKRIR